MTPCAPTQCGYTYRLGKDIFFTPSDSDPRAPVTAYTGSAYLVRQRSRSSTESPGLPGFFMQDLPASK